MPDDRTGMNGCDEPGIHTLATEVRAVARLQVAEETAVDEIAAFRRARSLVVVVDRDAREVVAARRHHQHQNRRSHH
jgi:hypothetical protein